MYIVWRENAIISDKVVELFVEFEVPGGRRLGPFDRPPWLYRPIYCRHSGPGRVCHIPRLVRAERVDNKVKQVLLRRFPGIRSCCLDDWLVRSAWWVGIDHWVRRWEEGDKGFDRAGLDCDIPSIVAKLQSVVPAPTRSMRRRWRAYSAECERVREAEWESIKEQLERQRRQDRLRAEWLKQEEARRAEWLKQEEARRAEEQQRQEQASRRHNVAGCRPGAPWWEILGVDSGSPFAEVKRAYLTLVKLHHPDRGGDAELFRRVEEAFEAYEDLGRPQ